MKLNKEELIIASILTAIVTPWTGWFYSIPACAVLWAATGMGYPKLLRRLGVPLVWATFFPNWFTLLAIATTFGFLSLGYGLPSTQPPDEGSWLGRIFKSDLIVRGIIYIGAITPFILLRIYG